MNKRRGCDSLFVIFATAVVGYGRALEGTSAVTR